MKKLSEYLFLWSLGGTIYYTFEVIFRGFSHWSMFALGGHLPGVLWTAGNLGRVGGCRLGCRCPVRHVCGGRRIYHRNHCEQVAGTGTYGTIRTSLFNCSDRYVRPFLILFSGLSVFGIFAGGVPRCTGCTERQNHIFTSVNIFTNT